MDLGEAGNKWGDKRPSRHSLDLSIVSFFHPRIAENIKQHNLNYPRETEEIHAVWLKNLGFPVDSDGGILFSPG